MTTPARDRDDSGRARNARPRDGLGRPLPYGATGTPRQPEGLIRTPAATLAEAQGLLDRGLPFHAHEVFEDAWKSADDPADRALWKALAQLSVGATHAARGNDTGAASLLQRAAAALEPLRGHDPWGVDVAGVISWAVAQRVGPGDDRSPVTLLGPGPSPGTGAQAAG